ncbi:MAG TPA: hypothetical protein VGV13_20890 [Methylomirabilota bacterium]|jgi:hypothetical protein|nr:hypothetical protein [Methylomirabilota bacterium]
MNGILIDSNVYYLPRPESPAPASVEPEWPTLWSRLQTAWWRLRLAVAEVRGILRRPRYRLAPGDYGALFEDAVELIVPSRPRRARPARVIDFESARLRLRPVPRD